MARALEAGRFTCELSGTGRRARVSRATGGTWGRPRRCRPRLSVVVGPNRARLSVPGYQVPGCQLLEALRGWAQSSAQRTRARRARDRRTARWAQAPNDLPVPDVCAPRGLRFSWPERRATPAGLPSCPARGSVRRHPAGRANDPSSPSPPPGRGYPGRRGGAASLASPDSPPRGTPIQPGISSQPRAHFPGRRGGRAAVPGGPVALRRGARAAGVLTGNLCAPTRRAFGGRPGRARLCPGAARVRRAS
jgi:hypothetical protein